MEPNVGWGNDAVGDNPPTDPPSVQRDAHVAPDLDEFVQPLWDEVVEAAPERCQSGNVWQDAYDARRVQRPSADWKSSSRDTDSQVNSLSDRPKCP